MYFGMYLYLFENNMRCNQDMDLYCAVYTMHTFIYLSQRGGEKTIFVSFTFSHALDSTRYFSL